MSGALGDGYRIAWPSFERLRWRAWSGERSDQSSRESISTGAMDGPCAGRKRLRIHEFWAKGGG